MLNFNSIKKYSKSITIEFLDTIALEKSYTSLEIGNKFIDPLVSPTKILYLCDELLFILFYLFMTGHEYSYTLGCATIIHHNPLLRRIYNELSQYVFEYSGLVSHDPMLYYVPYQPITSFQEELDNKLDFQILLLALFKNEKIEFNDLINSLERIIGDKPEYTFYNTLNILHGNSIDRNKSLKLCSLEVSINKIKKDLKIIQKIKNYKYRFNFYLRNINKIRNMLAPFRGYIYRHIESCDIKYSIFFMDFSKITLYSENKYFKYYLIEKYYKLLVEMELIDQEQTNGLVIKILKYLQEMKDFKFYYKKKEGWIKLHNGGKVGEIEWICKVMGL